MILRLAGHTVTYISMPVKTQSLFVLSGPKAQGFSAVPDAKHDSSWTQNLSNNTDIFLYQAKNKEEPYFYFDRGYEVGAVLQFIIDHYDCLPQVIISLEQQQFSCSLTHSYVASIAI